MEKSIEEIKKSIVRALREAGTYNRGLDAQIDSLAGAVFSLEMANRDIERLDCTFVESHTQYGMKMFPHPAFAVQKDAQKAVTDQMKILGLTSADLSGGDDNDPLVDLTKKVRNAGKSRKNVIKPGADD